MDKLTPNNGASPDIVAENIERLREIFPEVFADGNVDFDALKQTLGSYVDDREERYSFTWHGKSRARRIAQMPSSGTLLPCKEESVNWDSTQNIFIEGDNLEVLKILQKSYHRKVKMIYIDPPYNTGKEFIYPDKYQDNLDTYLKYTGQVDDEGFKLSANTETSGRYHTNWLNMMYPRLKLARNLLRDDGVILVHIDEHEEHALKHLLDEVFGEENRIGTCIWDKRNPKGDAKGIAYQHESLLLYARQRDALLVNRPINRPKANALKMIEAGKRFREKFDSVADARGAYREWVRDESGLSGGEAMYNRLDDAGRIYRLVSMAWPSKKKAPDAYFLPLLHPITGQECPLPARGWRNPPETMQRLLQQGLIEFGKDHATQPQRRYYLDENLDENIPSILPFGGSDDDLLARLKIPFEHPKPVSFAADLVS
jgi:adenine-specific DNA-methyltransferase